MNLGMHAPKKIDKVWPAPYGDGALSEDMEGIDPDDVEVGSASERVVYTPDEEDWIDVVKESWAPAAD